MADIRSDLDAAVRENLITESQVEPLAAFLAARRNDASPTEAADVGSPEEESEMPRFIRGYHDVLITIGIIVTLSGLGGLATVWAAAAATVVLAEIFIARQRLALPSFVLTMAAIIFTAGIGRDLFMDGSTGLLPRESTAYLKIAGLEFAMVALFYWRYRVPVALAALMMAAVSTVIALAMVSLYPVTGPAGLRVALLVGGLTLVGAGVALDFSDPRRISRRSDVAFWLYLMAVPLVLKAIFSMVDVSLSGGAVIILLAVVFMMLVGLLLDRRAFVTAGLGYLGYAFGTLIFGRGILRFGAQGDQRLFWIMLAIGIVVLVIGFGWRRLRKVLMTVVPGPLRSNLPIIR